jgi:hypothetical protein
MDDTQVTMNHCVKSTAENLSLPNRGFESESWLDTGSMDIRQLAIGTSSRELPRCTLERSASYTRSLEGKQVLDSPRQYKMTLMKTLKHASSPRCCNNTLVTLQELPH